MNTKDNGPYTQAVAITPHDATLIPGGATRAIYVGGAGDITCLVAGTAVLFKAVPVGTVLKVQTTRVNSTATTATNLLALN